MVMSQAHMPEPINWERVIEEEPVPDLEGPPREQGTQLHEWLRNRDELDYLDFERELSWSGRYDCNDGTYLYEFKTVGEIPGGRGPRTEASSWTTWMIPGSGSGSWCTWIGKPWKSSSTRWTPAGEPGSGYFSESVPRPQGVRKDIGAPGAGFHDRPRIPRGARVLADHP